MKSRLFPAAILLLFVCAAASASVTVTADDGAALRVDSAKLAKLTESALARAGAQAADVSIAIGAPEVVVYSGKVPDVTHVFEIVRVRFTIRGAKGVVESEPLMLDVGHDSTLDARFVAIHQLAALNASRAATLRR